MLNDLRNSISCTAEDLENFILSLTSLRDVLALCLQFSTLRDELLHGGDGVDTVFLDVSQAVHTGFRIKWSLLFFMNCSPC